MVIASHTWIIARNRDNIFNGFECFDFSDAATTGAFPA